MKRQLDSWLYGDPQNITDRVRGLREKAAILQERERKKKARRLKAYVKKMQRGEHD